MSNPLKTVALHWAHPSVHGVRVQIPWDTNLPRYGKNHFAFSKGTLRQIIAFTEGNCPHRNPRAIEAWMKGRNPTEINVGIDCSGFVYRVLDEACQMSGTPGLEQTLGTSCDYTALDTLTPLHLPIRRANDVRAGDTMRFNKGKHSGVVIETVRDRRGTLQEIWYAHSSFTRGPHIGWIEVGDPWDPIEARSQNWRDEMWDGLNNNSLRDLYFTSIHQSPFYLGPRPVATKRTGLSVVLAGSAIPFSVPPFTLNGHTLCQIRPLAEAMGAAVSWDNDSQTVAFRRGARAATCQVGSEVGVMDGVGYRLEQPPVLMGTHVVVPLRFVVEALGFEVRWDEARSLITLTRRFA